MSDNRRVGQRNSASSNLRSSPSYTCVPATYAGLTVCIRVHASTNKGTTLGRCVTTRNESKRGVDVVRTKHPFDFHLTSISFDSSAVSSMVNIAESPMFCNVTLRFEIRFRFAPCGSFLFSKRPESWKLKWEMKKIIVDKLRYMDYPCIIDNFHSKFIPWDITYSLIPRSITFIVNVNFCPLWQLLCYLNSIVISTLYFYVIKAVNSSTVILD